MQRNVTSCKEKMAAKTLFQWSSFSSLTLERVFQIFLYCINKCAISVTLIVNNNKPMIQEYSLYVAVLQEFHTSPFDSPTALQQFILFFASKVGKINILRGILCRAETKKFEFDLDEKRRASTLRRESHVKQTSHQLFSHRSGAHAVFGENWPCKVSVHARQKAFLRHALLKIPRKKKSTRVRKKHENRRQKTNI